jgi:hypothetical protein
MDLNNNILSIVGVAYNLMADFMYKFIAVG